MHKHALALLSKREYGFSELVQRLSRNYADEQVLLAVVRQLRDEDLQSDARFTESYIASRLQRGFGPVRIRQELNQKGISDELIAVHLREHDAQWYEQLRKVREKKYGKELPQSYQEQMRQAKFLQYRGFNHDQIRKIFRTDAE